MKKKELKQDFLEHLVRRCGDYKGLHKAVRKHKAIFEAYGITTYLNEINFDTQDVMLCVKKCLEDMRGTDDDIHWGYNDPEQGETGEDSGKYYLFVDLGV